MSHRGDAARRPQVACFRAKEGDCLLVQALERLGMSPLHLPLLAFEDGRELGALAGELREGGHEWVVVTSPRGAASLEGALATWPPGLRIAAVGRGTRARLEGLGLAVDLEGEGGGARGLLDRLPSRLEGVSFLWPTGDRSLPELPAGLRRRGARLRRLEVYRTQLLGLEERDREGLGRCEALAFTSPSTAEALAEVLGPGFPEFLRARVVGALGRATERRLRELGAETLLRPRRPRLDELAAVIARSFSP